MNEPEPGVPLVTVAIPLYRSRRFLEVIVENLQNLAYPNLEILIGDRHLADDTAEQLRAQFRDDARIRFVTATDELSWVAHYNLLLSLASGKYFLWMPHDDSYPAGYIGALVARLEARPDAVLAFGRMESLTLDGQKGTRWLDPPIVPGEDWTPRSALRLALGWSFGVAMRGVIRRSAVVDKGLWIRDTTGHAHADTSWLFGLALLGRFEFVPEARCLKRFYATSTHAQWKGLPYGEQTRVLGSYLRDYVPSRPERAWAMAAIWCASGLNRFAGLVNQVSRKRIIQPNHVRALFRVLLKRRWPAVVRKSGSESCEGE